MAAVDDIARIQSCIENPLDRRVIGKNQIAGIIGDAPSHYAKSPSIWNATFRALKMKAVYLSLDAEESRLPDLTHALRTSDRVMGVNITVPYKVKIMDYLDGLDDKAQQIKAVNTVVRTADGKLVGTNTDGHGFFESLMTAQPGEERPFIESLRDIDVLIIGAGGSARAVGFYLAETLGNGKLLICNRTRETARLLGDDISKIFGNAKSIKEEELVEHAPKLGLIVNCSIKGQGGIRKTQDGRLTTLEPYSALAPAHPAAISEYRDGTPEFYRQWLRASLADIEANNRASWNLALSIPLNVGFCDLIYFPAETVFLRHGRLTGHRTLNGKGMNVAQAAEAFFHGICREYLERAGLHNPDTYRRVLEIMWRTWS